MIASEYGGGPRVILEGVYFDETIPLIKNINSRKLEEYRMQVMIAHSSEPKKLLKMLESQKQKDRTTKLDTAGMEALKIVMSQNPKIIVK